MDANSPASETASCGCLAIDRAGTSGGKAAVEVCAPPAVGACRPGVVSPVDSDPSVEEVPLQPTYQLKQFNSIQIHIL